MSDDTRREMHLAEYWHILRKRRWVVLTAVAVLFTTVTIGSFLVTPEYRAKAVIQIERMDPKILDFRDVYSRDTSYQAYTDFYQTQYRLIESREVVRRVVERLDLPDHPAMLAGAEPGPVDRMLAWARSLVPRRDQAATPAETDPLRPWVAAVRGNVDVRPVKNTHLVEITYDSPDPALATAVANAVADEFILFNTEVKSRTTGLAGAKLDSELRTLTGEIEELDRQVRGFGTEHSVLEMDNKKSLALATLEELTQAATQARIQRARAEAVYESVRTAEPAALTAVLESPTIKELKGRLTDLEREYAEKSETFKPDYPEMVALRSQMTVARDQLAAELDRIHEQVVGGARTAYRTAVEEETRLSRLEDDQKQRLHELEANLAAYDELRSRLDTKKEMRASLLKRRDETGVLNRMDDTQAGNVVLIEAAEVPAAPFRPNKKLNMLLSLFVGVGLGVGLAFFFEYLDNSIKDGEELERLVGLPALGLIPSLRRRGPGKVVALDSGGRLLGVETITHDAPKSNHAEAYRDLRTTLLLSSPDRPPRTLMITSGQPREGKTVTTLNVAISLAQAGKRVLVVDADMRKPRVHKVMELERTTGLSSWLAGTVDWSAAVESTAIPGLSVLTAGPIPPNPAELLASNNFRRLVDDLRDGDRYDHVVFDTPPLLAVADPVIVSSLVEGVLLVVQGGTTPRQTVTAALDKLRAASARVLGAVINNVDLATKDYYAYRYGYRYGYYTSAESELQAGDDRAAATGGRV